MTSDHTTAQPGKDSPDPASEPLSFDPEIAHPARVYDFWLGGKDHYKADREAGELVIAHNPNVLPGVQANRAFLRRAVEYLVSEAGVRQFLDVGTGLPTANNTHDVAQALAPECRIVYVDNDPIVLSHARALLTSTPEGKTDYIQASAQDTAAILQRASETIDFTQPVAVMMLMILQYVPDADDPRGIAQRLLAPLAPGSYLAVSDTTRDIDTDRTSGAITALNTRMGPTQLTLRTREQILGYFDGLDLVEPGLVPVPEWRALSNPKHIIPCYAGMGRKPLLN